MLSWDTYKCWYACKVTLFFTLWHTWLDVQTAELSIQVQSEQFTIDRVTAVLEWTLSNSLSQYPQLLGDISVDVVPDFGVKMLLLGNTGVQLTLLYNTLYNVSIVQPAKCKQLSQAVFIELKYSELNVNGIATILPYTFPYTFEYWLIPIVLKLLLWVWS